MAGGGGGDEDPDAQLPGGVPKLGASLAQVDVEDLARKRSAADARRRGGRGVQLAALLLRRRVAHLALHCRKMEASAMPSCRAGDWRASSGMWTAVRRAWPSTWEGFGNRGNGT